MVWDCCLVRTGVSSADAVSDFSESLFSEFSLVSWGSRIPAGVVLVPSSCRSGRISRSIGDTLYRFAFLSQLMAYQSLFMNSTN